MKKIFSILKNDKGVGQVLVTLSMVAILGFGAMVIDIGQAFVKRGKLLNAVDAAALAGALELPTNPDKAIQIAKDYAVKNGVNREDINVEIIGDNSQIIVNANEDVGFTLAKILGFEKANISAASSAIIGPITEVYEGIRPFAVEKQEFNYGERVVLKEGAGDGYMGNYGAIALGGNGANNYRNNIKYGYKGILKVGDYVNTEPGNMAGPTIQGVNYITCRDHSTFENFSRDSLRLWTIPVVETLNVNGRKPVKIVGFALFFLEDAVENGGKTEITGRFIEFVTNGKINANQIDYGLKGVKLIQ